MFQSRRPQRQEVDSSGGHSRDACYAKDGKEEGRWGADAHAPSFSFLPGQLSVMLLWASVSICKMGGVTLALHTDW